VRKQYAETNAVGATHVTSVFAPKGGVGKTTIAFNLAVAMAQLEQKTVLIDGSVQFGDLRALLKVPVDAPSILDLPTDRIAESDLSDVLWRDPSGIDIHGAGNQIRGDAPTALVELLGKLETRALNHDRVVDGCPLSR